MTVIYGVDVSAYQGTVDWAKVKAAGISFAFAKATQGTTYTASNWAHNETEMIKLGAGFVPGAYHFLSATTAPEAQAEYFVSRLKHPESLAVALDVERYSDGSTRRPTAAQAKAFVTELDRLLPGKPVLGYLPKWYWAELGSPSLTFFTAGLWQSAYVSGSGTAEALYAKTTSGYWSAYGGRTPVMLQHSDSGRVAGIDGAADVDAYKGTVGALRKLLIPSGTPTPPPVVKPTGDLKLTGKLDHVTVAAMQKVLKVKADGVMGPVTAKALQHHLGVKADGALGPITVKALQRHVHVHVDGVLGPVTIKAVQAALNRKTF